MKHETYFPSIRIPYLFLSPGRLVKLVRCHTHVVEDVGQLAGVDPAIVGHILLTALVYVEVTYCK